MILHLSTSYTSRCGAPIISRIDAAIFTRTYFANCMQCGFCNDDCCSHGVFVSANEIKMIEKYTGALENYIQIPYQDWFQDWNNGQSLDDPDLIVGQCRRVRIQGRGCAFLRKKGRGCLIHGFTLGNGMDYHTLKPMFCCLFPISFDQDLLRPAFDVLDKSLVCLGEGVSVYKGVRHELLYYFGSEFIAELDKFETVATHQSVR